MVIGKDYLLQMDMLIEHVEEVPSELNLEQ